MRMALACFPSRGASGKQKVRNPSQSHGLRVALREFEGAPPPLLQHHDWAVIKFKTSRGPSHLRHIVCAASFSCFQFLFFVFKLIIYIFLFLFCFDFFSFFVLLVCLRQLFRCLIEAVIVTAVLSL